MDKRLFTFLKDTLLKLRPKTETLAKYGLGTDGTVDDVLNELASKKPIILTVGNGITLASGNDVYSNPSFYLEIIIDGNVAIINGGIHLKSDLSPSSTILQIEGYAFLEDQYCMMSSVTKSFGFFRQQSTDSKLVTDNNYPITASYYFFNNARMYVKKI